MCDGTSDEARDAARFTRLVDVLERNNIYPVREKVWNGEIRDLVGVGKDLYWRLCITCGVRPDYDHPKYRTQDPVKTQKAILKRKILDYKEKIKKVELKLEELEQGGEKAK